MIGRPGLRTQMRWALLGLLVVAGAGAASAKAPTASSYLVYAGTTSAGIYSYRFDSKTGQLTALGKVAECEHCEWLATDPQHRYLYVLGDGPRSHGAHQANGFLSSYSIDRESGKLTFLNQVDSGGSIPAHLVVEPTGKTLFVANYGTGSLISFAIKSDGSVGERIGFDQYTGSSIDRVRQEGPHAHEVVLSPDKRFLFVPDLGTDQIKIYRVDAAKGTFTPNDPPIVKVKPGLGPRHFILGTGTKFAYVLCEMGSSVLVFSYDSVKGSLTPVQTISNLPPDFTGVDNSSEIGIGRSGRFLYASNRGHDSITVFAIDPAKGTLTKIDTVPTGKIPRSFAIDPTGKYLVVGSQMSNNIAVFAIGQKDGLLKQTGQPLDISAPVVISFVPAE
jgi:6-phosphogluconolactonase